MKNVEWNTADLVPLLIGDQNRVVLIAQLRMVRDQLPRDDVSRIHGFAVAWKFDIAFAINRFAVRQVKVIKRHCPVPGSPRSRICFTWADLQST